MLQASLINNRCHVDGKVPHQWRTGLLQRGGKQRHRFVSALYLLWLAQLSLYNRDLLGHPDPLESKQTPFQHQNCRTVKESLTLLVACLFSYAGIEFCKPLSKRSQLLLFRKWFRVLAGVQAFVAQVAVAAVGDGWGAS